MLSLGRILISDLVVADLFMYSVSGMILLYLAALFFTPKVFLHEDIISFARFHAYQFRIIDSEVTPAEVDDTSIIALLIGYAIHQCTYIFVLYLFVILYRIASYKAITVCFIIIAM